MTDGSLRLRQRAKIGGMRMIERVCVCLPLTEMKHLKGQRSSHPQSSPVRRFAASFPSRGQRKHTGVSSSLVNDWLNKWTGSLWCRPFTQTLWGAERMLLPSEWWLDTHQHTRKHNREDNWYLNISQDGWGGVIFSTHSWHSWGVISYTPDHVNKNTHSLALYTRPVQTWTLRHYCASQFGVKDKKDRIGKGCSCSSSELTIKVATVEIWTSNQCVKCAIR